MDAHQLAYFLAVVDEGTFTRAAERLHIAQPSLSQAIHKLERDLGIDLFQRVGRQSQLTSAGSALVRPARHVMNALIDAREAVGQVKGMISGEVAVASMSSTSMHPLARTAAGFLEEHPGLRLRVVPRATANDVVETVRKGECSVGLLAVTFGASPRSSPQIGALRLCRQHLVLVSPPGPEWPSGACVAVHQLAGVRCIVGQEGTLVRTLVEDLIVEGIDLQVVAETGLRESVLPMVLAGVGCALLPEPWGQAATALGVSVSRLAPEAGFDVWLVYNSHLMTASTREFVAYTRRVAEER